jgi:hypothetical protein
MVLAWYQVEIFFLRLIVLSFSQAETFCDATAISPQRLMDIFRGECSSAQTSVGPRYNQMEYAAGSELGGCWIIITCKDVMKVEGERATLAMNKRIMKLGTSWKYKECPSAF